MRRRHHPLPLAVVVCAAAVTAGLAGCGPSGAGAAARPTATTTAPTTAATGTPTGTPRTAPSTGTDAPAVPLAQSFTAFFQGCEDGDVPPAGIAVTCDPSDGSDTAPAAAAALCAQAARDLGALAPAVAGASTGTALGVMNQGFPSTASALRPSGQGGRAVRCSYGSAARVDLAVARSDVELGGAVAGPAGDTCFGQLTPTVDVACRVASGEGFEVVLGSPATADQLAPVLAAFTADHV